MGSNVGPIRGQGKEPDQEFPGGVRPAASEKHGALRTGLGPVGRQWGSRLPGNRTPVLWVTTIEIPVIV